MADQIIFERVPWSPRMAAILSNALGQALRDISSEIVAGVSELWSIRGIGHMVTRMEISKAAAVLVVVAAQGRNTMSVLKMLPAIARANGARSGTEGIRIHSRRAGMARLLEPLGYRQEFGLGESIYHGRV